MSKDTQSVQYVKISENIERNLLALQATIKSAQEKYQLIVATTFEMTEHSGKNIKILGIADKKIAFMEVVEEKKEEVPLEVVK